MIFLKYRCKFIQNKPFFPIILLTATTFSFPQGFIRDAPPVTVVKDIRVFDGEHLIPRCHVIFGPTLQYAKDFFWR